MENVLLGLLLGLSIYFDSRYRRIPNKLTFSVIVLALFLHTIEGSVGGLLFSLKGLALGIALLLIPFSTGGMGAGDVKLLGAIGAVIGPNYVLWSIIYGAMSGGIIAAIILMRHKKLIPVLKHLWLLFCLKICKVKTHMDINITNIRFPYGIAIAIGTVIALWR